MASPPWDFALNLGLKLAHFSEGNPSKTPGLNTSAVAGIGPWLWAHRLMPLCLLRVSLACCENSQKIPSSGDSTQRLQPEGDCQMSSPWPAQWCSLPHNLLRAYSAFIRHRISPAMSLSELGDQAGAFAECCSRLPQLSPSLGVTLHLATLLFTRRDGKLER